MTTMHISKSLFPMVHIIICYKIKMAFRRNEKVFCLVISLLKFNNSVGMVFGFHLAINNANGSNLLDMLKIYVYCLRKNHWIVHCSHKNTRWHWHFSLFIIRSIVYLLSSAFQFSI